MHNGVPFRAAFDMSPAEEASLKLDAPERAAFSIVFSQFEGGLFDWDRMAWEERK